jgi:hypothetical protein
VANLKFVSGDIQDLSSQVGPTDVIVASNSLEHLHNPVEFLRQAIHVARDGIVILAVPPIFTTADAEVHADIHYHRANLSVQQWLALFASEGWSVECFAHRAASQSLLVDFASPFKSRLRSSDFKVEKSSLDDLYKRGAITAIFAVRDVRSPSRESS